MVPEIFLTGPVCVEGTGDPLHGLKTVPVNLIEQCLKCDKLQWNSQLSNRPKTKTTCEDNFRQSVPIEEPTTLLCLPVWLEEFLYLHVTKKPLHEPSRALQSWFGKQSSENGRLSRSSQTSSADEEPIKSEGSSVSGDVPAPPLGLPLGLEGCLYVQDIKKPVQVLKKTRARKHDTVKTSSTAKAAAREENPEGTLLKPDSPDELKTSVHSQDLKRPLQTSKAAKSSGIKSNVKIDNLLPISQSLRPVELRPRCQKVFVSGETSAVQAVLPKDLEESIFVQDIKNPRHEPKTPGTQIDKVNLESDDGSEEKQKYKGSKTAGLLTGPSRLPVGLEKALHIHDIKKPVHMLARGPIGSRLLKTKEATQGENKRLRETAVPAVGARRHGVPTKLEDTLSVQDIKKPVYQMRTTKHRVTKQSLKRENSHTKPPACIMNKDKPKSRDAVLLELAKNQSAVRLNESVLVQVLKNPLHKTKTSRGPLYFKKQNLNSNKNMMCCHPPTSRKKKLFLEEDPEEWYRHNIGLEKCFRIQSIKNPLHQSEAAQLCSGKRCFRCDKLLLAS